MERRGGARPGDGYLRSISAFRADSRIRAARVRRTYLAEDRMAAMRSPIGNVVASRAATLASIALFAAWWTSAARKL